MKKLTKQVLTGAIALGLLAPVATSINIQPSYAKAYMETYVQSTKRGVWGYSRWNDNTNKLYHRVWVKAGTKLYGEHDASRIGHPHFVSAFRTGHETKDTYIPKSAFNRVRHHKHTAKHHYYKHARKRRHVRKHYRKQQWLD